MHEPRSVVRFPGYKRRALTLLELIAVVVLLGIVVSVSLASYKPGTLGNLGAKVDSRHLALDLMQARRRAIATGDNHFIFFHTLGMSSSGPATKYSLYRRPASGGAVQIGSTYTFQKDLIVTSSPASPEFTFEGEATATFTIDVRGPQKRFSVTVNQVSGSVRVTAL